MVVQKAIGNITSPEYPSYYEPLTNCTWRLDVIRGNATLKLRTFDFRSSIFSSGGCDQDRFEVSFVFTTKHPELSCYTDIPSATCGVPVVWIITWRFSIFILIPQIFMTATLMSTTTRFSRPLECFCCVK